MPSNLALSEPFLNCVYQRGQDGLANIPIAGTCPAGTGFINVTFSPVGGGKVITQNVPVDASGIISTAVQVPGGWYSLSISAGSDTVLIDRVGSGEVFIKFGHSYIDGGQDATHQLPASDERVITLLDDMSARNYQFGKLSKFIGPQNGSPDAWGQFGDLLVSRLGVPVMLYGCAYGGSNLKMSLEVITGATRTALPPGVTDSSSRQPFAPFEYVMDNYVPKTGVRAVLFEHGYNDRGTPRATFLDMLKQFFDYVRNRWQKPNLAAIVVQEQLTAVPGSLYDIPTAQAQSDFISSQPNVWKGVDFNDSAWNGKFASHDHLYGDMIDLYARQFADSITATTFLSTSTPYGPSTVAGTVLAYNTPTINTLDWVLMVAAGLCLVGVFVWKNKLLTWGFLILALYAIARVSGKI